jgi:hypothetical protein
MTGNPILQSTVFPQTTVDWAEDIHGAFEAWTDGLYLRVRFEVAGHGVWRWTVFRGAQTTSGFCNTTRAAQQAAQQNAANA